VSAQPHPPEDTLGPPADGGGGTRPLSHGPGERPHSGRVRWRGLPVVATAVLALGITVAGGLLDAGTSGELGTWFTVGFVLSALVASLGVRSEDLIWGLILPPLVFAASVLLTSPVVPGGTSGSVHDQLLELGTTLALKAPDLTVGTLVATVLVVVRRLRG